MVENTGFYIIMGGFHLSEHPKRHMIACRANKIPLSIHLRNLNKEDTTIDVDFSSFTVPTEAEIKDKGKSDWLAKSLVSKRRGS